MKSIFYLWRTQLKNRILALKKNPGMLVLYVFIAIFFLFAIFASFFSANIDIADISEELSGMYLGGLCAGLFILFSYLTLLSSLNTGATLFTLSDVHFLFPSPVPPKNILVYGIIKQMGMSFLGCIFVAFQGANLRQLGLGSYGLVALYLGLVLTLFMSNITASVIYSYTNGNRKKRFLVKVVLYGSLLVIAAAVLYQYMETRNLIDSALSVANATFFDYLPVFGWVKGLFTAIRNADILRIVIFSGITIVYSFIMCLLIARNDGDFYEDVIGAAERKAEIRAIQKADGNNMRAMSFGKKVKVRDTGIHKGAGASAIFYRQMREVKRKGMFFIDGTTLLIGAIAIFMVLVMRPGTGSGENQMPPEIPLFIAFGIAGYMYLFFSMTGMWATEIKKPFIYLIPDSNFKKLVYASLTSVIKSLVDGVVIFFIIGILLGLPFWQWIVCALAFASFGLIYTAGDMLCNKIFRRSIGQGILRFFYFLILMVLLVPGIVITVLTAIPLSFVGLMPLCLLALLITNVVISGVIVLLCRNLLDSKELD